MARKILQGQTVELRGGTLRGTEDCPVAGSVKGAKAVVVREPRRCEGPSGKIEDRVVVKPILGNGAMGFPIELSADNVGTSGAFLPNLCERLTRPFRRKPKQAAPEAPRSSSRRAIASGFGPGKLRPNYGYQSPALTTAED